MSFRNVNGTTIIYGGSAKKPNQIANVNDLEKKYKGGKNSSGNVNAMKIERQEETLTTLAYPVIPRDISQAIQDKRKELGLNKQVDLQQKCQVPIDIIKAIENGTLQLTQQNRQYLHKVARTLNMPALNLPKSV
jgi:ribosome-binding protein aMBF1 (putative translation factor)